MKTIRFPVSCVSTARQVLEHMQKVDPAAAKEIQDSLFVSPDGRNARFVLANAEQEGLFLAVLKEVPLVQPDSPTWVNPHSPPVQIPQAA